MLYKHTIDSTCKPMNTQLKLSLASALLALALSPAHADTLLSAGVQHADIGGHSLNQIGLAADGMTGSVSYGFDFADGNHNGFNARSYDLSAGYALPIDPSTGLRVSPSVLVGRETVDGYSADRAAVGLNAAYVFKDHVQLGGLLYAGRTFRASQGIDAGEYTKAGLSVGYPVGPGEVLAHYTWSRQPASGASHLISSGVGVDYAMAF